VHVDINNYIMISVLIIGLDIGWSESIGTAALILMVRINYYNICLE